MIPYVILLCSYSGCVTFVTLLKLCHSMFDLAIRISVSLIKKNMATFGIAGGLLILLKIIILIFLNH